MVGANTFRNPGLTAKLATTLDHVSAGRAVLGIGGAWFEREHDAFGIDFGASPGERLGWLDESVMLMRRLLDGERVSHDGPRYTMHDALCEPRPIQAASPDPHRWQRPPEDPAHGRRAGGRLEHVGIARGGARTPSRPSSATARTSGATRRPSRRPSASTSSCATTPAAAEARTRELLGANGVEIDDFGGYVAGTPPQVAETLAPYRDLGFETFIVRMPAPYDLETIERMREVAEILAR